VAQRAHRVDASGPPRRRDAGGQARGEQHSGARGEHERVARLDAEELALDDARAGMGQLEGLYKLAPYNDKAGYVAANDALGSVSHAHIVSVYDFGESSAGCHDYRFSTLADSSIADTAPGICRHTKFANLECRVGASGQSGMPHTPETP
jgi:hypothetical protein